MIDGDGAKEAFQLFSSLVNVLKLSPKVLTLTGAYTFVHAYDDVIDPNENVDRILRETAGYDGADAGGYRWQTRLYRR